jgi:hypothetical protein
VIYTTLNRIRAQSPCTTGWTKLLRGLGKTAADNEPLGFDAILGVNGADDALWCLRAEPQHDRLWRMVAVRCARTVQHLMTDPRSAAALDVAERHAHGLATTAELATARDAAWAAAMKQAGEILLSAVSSSHADPERLGVRETATAESSHE